MTLSIIFVIIGLSLIIIIHELGHFLVARFFNLYIEEFGIGFPPRVAGRFFGETLYSLNLIPLGGFVKIYGENLQSLSQDRHPSRSFAHQKAWKRALIIVAGVVMNFIFGWLLISAVLFIGSPSVIFIDQVAQDSPAASVGLEAGDIVLGYENAAKFVDHINANKGREIVIAVRRDSQDLTLRLTPRLNPPAGQGALGIAFHDAGLPKHDFFSAIGQGFSASIRIVAAVFIGLYQAIFTPDQILGPVGIFGVAINTGQQGLIFLFQFLGLISLNLVVLNILPIPALDGGRLLFIIIEKIRGQRFSPKFEMRANAIGFAALLALILLITIKDVVGLL